MVAAAGLESCENMWRDGDKFDVEGVPVVLTPTGFARMRADGSLDPMSAARIGSSGLQISEEAFVKLREEDARWRKESHAKP